jgi:hypothetical protein
VCVRVLQPHQRLFQLCLFICMKVAILHYPTIYNKHGRFQLLQTQQRTVIWVNFFPTLNIQIKMYYFEFILYNTIWLKIILINKIIRCKFNSFYIFFLKQNNLKCNYCYQKRKNVLFIYFYILTFLRDKPFNKEDIK